MDGAAWLIINLNSPTDLLDGAPGGLHPQETLLIGQQRLVDNDSLRHARAPFRADG